MSASPSESVNKAIAAMRAFDRRGAAAHLRSLIEQNAQLGQSWKSVAKLADQMGEIDISVEAMRRFALTEPQTLDKRLAYLSELATRGRDAVVDAVIAHLPRQQFERTEITFLRGTLASQRGDFRAAEALLRRAIEEGRLTGQNWLALSMIKKFESADPDLAEMRRLAAEIGKTPAASQANFHYALGKALHDSKEFDAAFEEYARGAAIKRADEAFDAAATAKFTASVIEDFDRQALDSLKPSQCMSDRPIFVTGLPRSGTTLVEQILTTHSAVADGAEVNLFRAALQPAWDFSWSAARRFNDAPPASYSREDPWGSAASDYLAMLDQRFGESGRVVDKTLNHSRFLGLILHALPAAKVVWLRRDPEDAAISVFRNFFASAISWSWSLTDIAHYFRTDDALHAHWSRVFPDRILTVPYEALTADPEPWITRILAHVGLPAERSVYEPHKQEKRSVRTASVAQVREPISTGQIGAAKKYYRQMREFRDAYFD